MTEQDQQNVFEVEEAGGGPDKKFCSSCGASILRQAEICPRCGVRQQGGVNKIALVLITFFLGGIGGHKFYLRKYGQGVLYLLFFWTLIPSLVAFVEFLIYAFTGEQQLQERYPANPSAVAVVIAFVGLFGMTAILGILAAIAIPQYSAYRMKAFDSAAKAEIQSGKTCLESFFVDNGRYPLTASEVGTGCPDLGQAQVKVFVVPDGDQSYQLVSFHPQGSRAFIVSSDSSEVSDNDKAPIESQIESDFEILEARGNLLFIE